MDKIREIFEKNNKLISDINNHSAIFNNILGILKNIEKIIPEDCRQNFYNNLEVLRVIPSNQSECSLDAPIILIEEKLLWLADNNIINDNYNFSDVLVEELYHELLHLSSTNYIVDLDSKKVKGFSGFVIEYTDKEDSNNLFNGLTEGFTQYLTSINNNMNLANYDTQINCIKKLIDVVGIDALKQSYFDNKLGMQPIIDKLSEKGMNADYLYHLEEMCHVDIVTHSNHSENNNIGNKTR